MVEEDYEFDESFKGVGKQFWKDETLKTICSCYGVNIDDYRNHPDQHPQITDDLNMYNDRVLSDLSEEQVEQMKKFHEEFYDGMHSMKGGTEEDGPTVQDLIDGLLMKLDEEDAA